MPEHAATIRHLVSFVIIVALGPALAAANADQPSPFDTRDWVAHPAVGLGSGVSLLPVSLFGLNYVTPQLRFDANLRLAVYLDERWYLGTGIGLVYSIDTDAKKVIVRPGLTSFVWDLAFGIFQRTSTASLAPGVELRFGGQFGAINGTELYTFFLRTELRPFVRLLENHLEIGLPLLLALRRDPSPAFDLGAEVMVVF